MTQALDALSFLFLTSGAIVCVIGAVGMLRLPDIYTRTHAATITDTLGAGLILVGLMFQAGLTLVTVKLILTLFFLYYTSPVAGHALVKAAFGHGLRAELAPPDAPQNSGSPAETTGATAPSSTAGEEA